MITFSCNCKIDCTAIAVIASIIIGIIAAVLSFTAVITVTPAFLWALFGIAVLYLAVTFLASGRSREIRTERCLCPSLTALFTGILGTILTSIILLGISFAATSIIGAIITGALLLFFSLLITSTVCVIRCRANCPEINEV